MAGSAIFDLILEENPRGEKVQDFLLILPGRGSVSLRFPCCEERGRDRLLRWQSRPLCCLGGHNFLPLCLLARFFVPFTEEKTTDQSSEK